MKAGSTLLGIGYEPTPKLRRRDGGVVALSGNPAEWQYRPGSASQRPMGTGTYRSPAAGRWLAAVDGIGNPTSAAV